MKALIISDDESIVTPVDNFLKQNQFDTIIYRWMIKAIDNIEEIKPDLIIISAAEYPRHWKTLVQFVKSGIGGDNVTIFLYEPVSLLEQDLEKAKELQVNYFTSLEEDELNKIIECFIPANYVIFSHPENRNIYTGKMIKKSEGKIQIKTDYKIPELVSSDFIKHISLSLNNEIKSLQGTVISVSNDCFTLELQD